MVELYTSLKACCSYQNIALRQGTYIRICTSCSLVLLKCVVLNLFLLCTSVSFKLLVLLWVSSRRAGGAICRKWPTCCVVVRRRLTSSFECSDLFEPFAPQCHHLPQISIREGLLAPIAASVSLFGCYLLVKFLPDLDIGKLLNAYFWCVARWLLLILSMGDVPLLIMS